MKHPELIYLFKMLENVILIVCVTYAATTFDNWKLLWFLLLALINYPSLKWKNNDKTKEVEVEH